jgi:Cytochrome c
MEKLFKIFGIFVGAVIILVIAGIAYLEIAYPKANPPENIKIDITPDRIERGKYLANNVVGCIDCHSTRDWKYFSGPLIEGTEGKGGESFTEEFGFPGSFYASNITPSGIGNWTDGELVRAITCGVSKDGGPLFPLMPFLDIARMDKEDVYSIVAYIRTLKPITNEIPKSKPNFPFILIERTIPLMNPDYQKRPDNSDKNAYSKYITSSAGCITCHTKQEKGKPVEGMEFAGGWEFPMQGVGIVRSSNITPDIETGIGKWTRDFFIAKFKRFNSPENKILLRKGQINSVMPWTDYAGMTEDDIGAIYDYLKTVKPVINYVNKFTPNP